MPHRRALALVALLAGPALGQDVPELHTVRRVTLGPSYSCRVASEMARGYQGTALFLTEYARLSNSPELLFDGACGGNDTFRAHISGDDTSVVADLGPLIPVETLSAWRAFNPSGLSTPESWSPFRREVNVVQGHTYAALLSDRERRALLLFQVESHVPNRRVDLRLVVKQYQLLRLQAESPGFSWEAASVDPPAEVLAQRVGALQVLRKDVLLLAPLERVWSVLTEARPGSVSRVEAVPGGRWELPELAPRRVLSLVPYEQLALSGSVGESALVLALAPEGGTRTRLSATLSGAGEAFQRDRAGQAEALVALVARLAQLLASERAAPPGSPAPAPTGRPRPRLSRVVDPATPSPKRSP